MTIIAGFVRPRGDSVALWADSAINHPFGVKNPQSSLGEMSEGDGHRTTEEGVIKLVQLTSHAAATLASNDAEAGHAFIRRMQPHMTSQRPLRDLLRDGVGAVNISAPTRCLFARYLGRPELCLVSFPEGRVDEVAISVEGSPAVQLRLSVLAAIEQGVRAGCSNEQVIAALQAVFLMRSCQTTPFQDGVGGATFGLVITRDGLKWGDDVGWIVLPRDTKHQPVHGIIYIRNGVGIVWSTLLGNAGRAFVHYRTEEERARYEAVADEIPALANELSADHVIVTMSLSGTAALVDPEQPPKVVDFGRELIRVDEDLVKHLFATRASGPLSVFPSPSTRHPGEVLIDRPIANVDDGRVLAEYIRFERHGSIAERYSEIRDALLRQFADDAWLREELAEVEDSSDAANPETFDS
jgi:hypothetical protein